VTPEALARLFHEVYEALAPRFGYETRKDSAVPWDEVPHQNKALMTAVAAEILKVMTPTMLCQDCEFWTNLVYDAACHSYSTGHTTVVRPSS
jgi:hypothetical protein